MAYARGGLGVQTPPIGQSTKMYRKKYHVFSTSEPAFLQRHDLQHDLKQLLKHLEFLRGVNLSKIWLTNQ